MLLEKQTNIYDASSAFVHALYGDTSKFLLERWYKPVIMRAWKLKIHYVCMVKGRLGRIYRICRHKEEWQSKAPSGGQSFSRQKIQVERQGKVSPDPVKESVLGESGDIKNHKGKTVEGGMFMFWWGLHLTCKGFQTRFEQRSTHMPLERHLYQRYKWHIKV